MTALWISQVDVTDPQAHARYAKAAGQVIARFGGQFLVRGGRAEQLEGAGRSRHVVVRFPSLDAARDCFHAADYRAALALAEGASLRDLVIVEEVAPPAT